MSLKSDSLLLPLHGSQFALSARRIWEHTGLGQVNVFNQAIHHHLLLPDAFAFIDVVEMQDGSFSLLGFTAWQYINDAVPNHFQHIATRVKSDWRQSTGIKKFGQDVLGHLLQFAKRQAIRNPYQPFLPTAKHNDLFGVPHLYSALQRRLVELGKAKLGYGQWRNTIQNFTQKGIRQEEIDLLLFNPAVNSQLMSIDHDDEQTKATDLVAQCQFQDFQISILAVHQDAQTQLKFTTPPDKKLASTKKQPKGKIDQVRDVVHYDPVLGYRLEKVTHQTLWGEEAVWQAVTNKGQVIRTDSDFDIHETANEAASVASVHATHHFPKQFALGKFAKWNWTGSVNYREWLITLPYYPESYLAGHFNIRNVLAHIRCDVRENAGGERVFMLQELQSDWVQSLRRSAYRGEEDLSNPTPPFSKEWQAFAMKLVFIHAALEGFDYLAWTKGVHQTQRYKKLTTANLTELYDRTLPREVNRLLKPYGISSETLEVYVPANYQLRAIEGGYEVFTSDGVRLGAASTLEKAQAFLPNPSHDLLHEVHGVKLSAKTRTAILTKGFPAWG